MLGFTYLSKYPDQFSNVSIIPIARPLIMSNFFGLVDEVDSHNNPRQLYIALENF